VATRRVAIQGIHLLYCSVAVVLFAVLLWGASVYYDNTSAKVLSGGNQLSFKQIAAGYDHSCAIASNNKAYCWGDGQYGQIGNGSLESPTSPVAVAQGEMPTGATIRQIAVGSNFTCAVASDDKAYCWGNGTSGRLGNGTTDDKSTPVAVSQGAMPAGATIRQLVIGNTHACAIASDNKAYCWGSGGSGRLGNASSSNRETPVAVSQGAIPAGATAQWIAAGDNHTCLIASDSKAYCWGSGANGALGNGDIINYNVPVAVSQGAIPAGVTFLKLSAGGAMSCAIASDNKAYCWGANTAGYLGNGNEIDQTAPVAVVQGQMPPGATIQQISSYDHHTCVVASDSKAYCWGSGSYGRLGYGSSSSIESPVAVVQGEMPVGLTFVEVSAGQDHTCAIGSNGKAYCWGLNGHGQLGNASLTNADSPSQVIPIYASVSVAQSSYRLYGPSSSTSPGSPLAGDNQAGVLGAIAEEFRLRIGLTNSEVVSSLAVESVVTGGSLSCAITSSGEAYCWGGDADGQLGNGSVTGNQSAPVAVLRGEMPPEVTFRQIALGNDHACAIASNNKAYCWGDGADGQLGNGSTSDHNAPVAVLEGAMPAGATFRQITAGDDFTCAVASDNKAYCWGEGAEGRLGNGTLSGDQLTPVAVLQGALPAGATFRQLSSYSSHVCAIASDGKPYCWGKGSYGRLGNGSETDQPAPVAVAQGAIPVGASVRQIVAGGTPHSCLIASDNKAYCWGRGVTGSLGNGSTSNQAAPVAVSQGAMPTGATIQQITAGNAHTCAVASDSKAYCWGNNLNSQVGDGGTSSQSSPVAVSQGAVPVSATIRQISSGNEYSCAVSSGHKTYCWGWGEFGRLGNGDTVIQTTPVAVIQGEMEDTTTTIKSDTVDLSLQMAPLGSAGVCSAVSSGWETITSSSAVSWGSAPPSHGTAIGAFGSDPAPPAGTTYVYQSVIQNGSFTNRQAIAPQQTALWDVVLDDKTSKSATDYCIRIVSNTANTTIDTYQHYPRIQTAMGELSVRFVDTNGTPLSGIATNTAFTPLTASFEVQQTSGMLADYATSRILEVHNSLSNSGWSVSLAATDGPTARWQSTNDSYAYNDENGVGGLLGVEADGMDIAADGYTPDGVACSALEGVSPGAYGTYSSTVSAVTIFSGSPSAQFNCRWLLWDIELDQIVPAGQSPGEYGLDMTLTIVAN
jgi:alpha-tubulin suppressor-like RCC1 family protein